MIVVTFTKVNVVIPVILEVYSPIGFRFLSDCLSPEYAAREDEGKMFMSCNEKSITIAGTEISLAKLTLKDGGLNQPADVELMIRTPKESLSGANFWIVTGELLGNLVCWSRREDPFPIRHMAADF